MYLSISLRQWRKGRGAAAFVKRYAVGGGGKEKEKRERQERRERPKRVGLCGFVTPVKGEGVQELWKATGQVSDLLGKAEQNEGGSTCAHE